MFSKQHITNFTDKRMYMYCASTAVAEADEAKEATVDDQGGGDAPASHKGSEIAVQPSAGSMTKHADVTWSTSATAAEQ